ncbi:PQQ-dependent sugar dehydrogenase [Metabacillus indicus]|uniref:PQQ-dependent sugar dehydrogenase n=1 Tax=Metabacillus indicus TaxID=246786 RepID=UPI0031827CB3
MIVLRKWFAVGALIFLAGCQSDQESPESEAVVQQEGQGAESVLKEMDVPWSINEHSGTFYLSERKGKIVKWDSASGEKDVQDVSFEKKVHLEGEGGFLGLQLAPDFDQNRQAYAYHTYKDGGTIKNRIVVIEEKNGRWEEVRVLLEDIPGARFHNGGRLKIGPDDKLYATAGDALTPELAQDRESLAGKILRLELDGALPDDNPFPESYVYSYGHRNPQGLAWSDNGEMYSTEHGQSAHDEINRIMPGRNYGWPVIEGDEQQEGMETPFFHTGSETWAPSGIAYKDGRLYVAALSGNAVKRVNINSRKAANEMDGFGRMRDVLVTGSGIYAITNNRDGRGNPRPGDDQLLVKK